MAPRAYWSGHLRLSLVSLPVRLYPAISSGSKLTLHKIHQPTGERVRYQNVVPDHGPVPSEEIVRGYEFERGRYVTLEPEEVDAIKVESKKTFELVQFVDSHEIDPLYFERPYFVLPEGDLAEEGFLVIREALRARPAAGDAALPGGGAQRRPLFRRHRGASGGRGPAQAGDRADRPQERAVRPLALPGPLPRRIAGADRRQG